MKPIEAVHKLLGMKIEQLRTLLGMTQAELAKRVGLSRPSVVNIERGRQRLLLSDVEKFSTALGTTPKTLLRGIWT